MFDKQDTFKKELIASKNMRWSGGGKDPFFSNNSLQVKGVFD